MKLQQNNKKEIKQNTDERVDYVDNLNPSYTYLKVSY